MANGKDKNKEAGLIMKQMFSEVIARSLKNLDGYTDIHFNDLSYIPESLNPVIKNFVITKRKDYDFLRNELEKYDKASDQYMSINNEIEHVQRSLMNLKGDVDLYKKAKMEFKKIVPGMNKGTQDANHFLNSAIFGELSKAEIDVNGNLLFAVGTPNFQDPNGEPEIKKHKMKDMSNPMMGAAPIITEPYGTKNMVWKLAEDTHKKKELGAGFDKEWTRKVVANNINEFGPNNTIGTAFTDLAGDGRTKSFADQYEEGLKPKFYTHPITGEKLPTDSTWMKDPANTEVLGMLLTDYIVDVMADIYGVIDPETGKIDRTPGDKARELIAKYSKRN